ncbi:MAG: hypothetical protein M3R52_03550 [Acidobacteriota bacterium]|nr:hypothetical protein [Acidobacteriota bacterium]
MSKNGQNGHNGHGHVRETPDVSHIKNIDVTHEASDVNVGGILKFVVGLTIFGITVNILMWGMFRFFNAQEVTREPKKGPMAMTKEERLPPEPRLQAAPGFGVKLVNGQWVSLEKRGPEAEYRVLREQWERQLYCKESDESHLRNLPCVPIDAAMEKLFAGGGLPVRAQEKDAGHPPDISLPTAASSGRVTGKGSE